jgi:branched-chain amino acid transport system substrate-binding protein
MKKRFIAVCLAALMALALAACETGSGTSGGTADGGLGVDEIVIGYVGAITGPSAALGQPIHEIAQWTIDEMNKNGGINGVPVRYVYRDDTGDPTKAATYVRELVEREGAMFMLGPCNSTCVAASLDYLTEEKIVTMLCSASATNLIDPEAFPYMFRTQVNNDIMAEALVRDAKNGGFENVVVIGDNGTLGSDGIAATEKYAEDYELALASSVQFAPGAVDMTPVAQDIVSADADLVIGFSTGADAAKVVAALDRVGHTGKYFYLGYMGTTLPNFAELAGEEPTKNVTSQGLLCASIGEDEVDDPKLGAAQEWYDMVADTFGEYYLDGSGRTWGWIESARAYDCLQMFKWAIEETNSVDPDTIKEKLEDMENFESVIYTSGYTMGEDHEGFNVEELVNCYQGQYLYDVGTLRGEPITVRCTLFD